jgi:S1-C subfamily serine protease
VEVVEGSPAAGAGMRPGDLIVEVDGASIDDVGDLQRLMVSERIGRPLEARVLREERELRLSLAPVELPT